MKMTWLQLFGLLLFSAHVYGRSQLAVNPLSLIYLFVSNPNWLGNDGMHMDTYDQMLKNSKYFYSSVTKGPFKYYVSIFLGPILTYSPTL